MRRSMIIAAAAALGVSGCVTAPTGPTVAVMPADGKPLPQFQQDDMTCRGYATQLTGGRSPAQAANDAGVNSAVAGTLIGGAAGAVLGAVAGNPGAGAAIGAGAGLLTGGSVGAANAQYSGAAAQHNYDVAYAQCMTANGNKVPTNAFNTPAPYGAYPAGYGYGGYPYPYGYYPYPYYGPAYGPSFSIGFGYRGGYRRW